MIYKTLILICLFLISGCMPMDETYSIILNNNSTQDIEVFADYLSDTLLPGNKPHVFSVKAKSQGYITDRYINDDELNRFKNEKLTIFIFNIDTLSKYSWSEVVEDYKVLKRYEINQQDLIDMGGAVTYP